MDNSEPQDQATRGTNIHPLWISFLDRRKDHVKRWRPTQVTERDLHEWWLDKHLLNVLTPGYILYSTPPNNPL